MKFAKSRLPPDWPSPLHNKCSKSSCNYPNLPQPAPGTYICVGCGKGSYVVTMEMAAEADAQCRRAFEFQEQNRQKYRAIQETSERRRRERDFSRYEREDKTAARREKWNDRPGSPLERRSATKGPGSPVARPPLRSTPAVLQPPALIIPPPRSSSKNKSSSKPPKSPKTPKSPKAPSSPPRSLSPKNLFATLTRKTPEHVYNPYSYNPNWQAEVDALMAKRKQNPADYSPPPSPSFNTFPVPRPRRHDPNLCSRNCPIHSKPKDVKAGTSSPAVAALSVPSHPAVPVRPPRPPTISLSIHSKPSKESFNTAANYYASNAQLDLKGYMPRPINGRF